MDTPIKQVVILTKGLSGAGKSYWSKQYIKDNPNTKIVCKDDLRAMLDNGKYTKGNENFVLNIRDSIILAAIEEGKNVIVADTNLAEKHLTHIKQLVGDKATVEIKSFLDVPIETCIKQDLNRLNSVGKDVILKQYYDFICTKEKPKYDSRKEDCILVDLDGTLAINNHNRSYFDASTCDRDDVCYEVLDILNVFSYKYKVIFLTGREEKYKEPTVKFLSNIGYLDNLLLMRTNGDSRKDYVIKEELYKTYIEPKFNVKFVLDDRNSVVRNCWNKLGLFVFKVGREYEF